MPSGDHSKASRRAAGRSAGAPRRRRAAGGRPGRVLAVGRRRRRGRAGSSSTSVRRSEMNARVRPSGEKRGWPVVPRAERQLARPVAARRSARARARGGSHRSRARRSGRVDDRERAVGRQARLGRDPQAVQVVGARRTRHGHPPDRRDARSLPGYHRPTMADQLSLRLEADLLPDLPDLRPMLPRPLPEPFDSDEHLFEPWWGGERALVFDRAGRRGRATARSGSCDADGTGPDGGTARAGRPGRPRRCAVGDPRRGAGRRRRRGPGRCARAGAAAGRRAGAGRRRSSPSTCSTSTAGRCCRSRSSAGARRCAGSSGRATRSSPCPRSRPRAIALFEAAVAQGIAGILARQRTSPYLPGVRSRLWRFMAATPAWRAAAEPDGDSLEAPGPRQRRSSR